MPTTSLRGAEKEGAGGQVLQHRKSLSSKVTVNDLHMNLENMVSLLTLDCDTIFLTQMHWHEGSPSLPRSRVNLLAQAISPIEAVNHTYHHIPGMPAPTRQCTGTCLLPPETQRGNPVPQHEIPTDMLSY